MKILQSILYISVGASIGATLRWLLMLIFQSWHQSIVIGTLLANWIGGFVIGVAVVALSAQTSLNNDLKLFLVTGLLGGLTTFSAFSIEAVHLLNKGDYLTMFAHISLHVCGSILLTYIGMIFYQKLFL